MSDFEVMPIGTAQRLLDLEAALQPFADFADPRRSLPAEHPITQGSPMARRQLTMGDCYAARDAIERRFGRADSERRLNDVAKGPFAVAKGVTFVDRAISPCDLAVVLDGQGASFAYVAVDDCAGHDAPAARARATRIAEALNKADRR